MQLIEAFVHNPVKVVRRRAAGRAVRLHRAVADADAAYARGGDPHDLHRDHAGPAPAPQEIEREIVQEQEEQLKGVEGVTKMSAECSDSSGTITLEFDVGTDLSEGLLKVNTRLQQVPEYPEDADEPVISTSDPRANAIAWFILRPRVASPEEIAAFLADESRPGRAARAGPGRPTTRACGPGGCWTLVEEHPELDERIETLLPPEIDVPKLRLFAEDFIEARFERVPGVSNSNVFGGREEEMQVIVDPAAAGRPAADDPRRPQRPAASRTATSRPATSGKASAAT